MAPRRMLSAISRLSIPSGHSPRPWRAVVIVLVFLGLAPSARASIVRPPLGPPVFDPGEGFGVPNEPDAPNKGGGLLVTLAVHPLSWPLRVWLAPRPSAPPHAIRSPKPRQTWR